MVSVTVVSDDGFESWDRFVAAMGGGPMHLSAWYRILRDAYSVKPLFLQAQRDNGAVCGVLPLYFSRSMVTGRHLASLDGGILASDAEATEALLKEAKSLRRQLAARYLLLRGAPEPKETEARRTIMDRRIISTSSSVDTLWRSLTKDTRNQVRRGERAGYVVNVRPLLQILPTFYQIFARRMRSLGTPVVPFRLFTAMAEHFGPSLLFFTIEKDGELRGGLITAASGTKGAALYTAVEPGDMKAYANYLLFWRIMEHFATSGMASLDLGTNATGTSVVSYKASWPTIAEAVAYDVYSDNEQAAPRDLRRTASEKSLAQRVWQKLPLPVANFVGPLIRAQLPFA